MADEDQVDATKEWLRGVIAPMLLPEHRAALDIIHCPVQLLAGDELEHKFVVVVPPGYGGLLVGVRGKTAGAFRILLRSFAQSRRWAAQVDLRIKDTRSRGRL